jgi:putative NADH-flavin reductase
MKIMIFGATGRIGSSVVEQALAAGHQVTAFVRDARRLTVGAGQVQVVEGNVLDSSEVEAALRKGFEAIVVAIGGDPLKPSTLVTDAARSILTAAQAAGTPRYLAVTGTAEMPNKTLIGKISTFILRLTPVGNAIRDHDGAYALVIHSGLDWMLAGCPWVKDGPRRGGYKTSLVFPGGNKFIYPPDVADLFVRELAAKSYCGQVVGLWY